MSLFFCTDLKVICICELTEMFEMKIFKNETSAYELCLLWHNVLKVARANALLDLVLFSGKAIYKNTGSHLSRPPASHHLNTEHTFTEQWN